MKIIQNTFILLCFLLGLMLESHAQITPVDLRCEYLTNPMGVDIPDPRFYWKLQSAENEQFQIAYQLIVSSSKENLNSGIGDMFDSGKKRSAQNTHVVYSGKTLQPAKQYFWKVRVWDKNNQTEGWSEAATFSTGLFSEEDWAGADWIAWKPQDEWEENWWKRKEVELQCTELYLPSYFGARMNLWERYNFHQNNPYDPSPLMRKTFQANKEIEEATVFISGIGYNELYLNGQRIGDHVLDPGWTNYNKTILYTTYDVTPQIKQGKNAIGVMLGRGNYGLLAVDHWGFYKKGGYVGQPKLKYLLKISYKDGTTADIISDQSWKVTGGPIIYDGPHMGEIYDARKEIDGWSFPEMEDSSWSPVQSAPAPGGELRAQLCEPIRIVNKFKPVIVENKGWYQMADAGTNLAGWIRLKIDEPEGTRVLIYYGEKEVTRDEDQPGGYQQMAYIAKGVPGEIAECHFSYKGFRFVNIVGLSKPLSADDIEICQVNSDVDKVGQFSSSDSTLNAIHRICTKSMISNLHSIPTDCPHREKNGWMGDATTGIEFGMANYNLAAILTKFTRDMFDTQDKTGAVSMIAPDNDYGVGESPLWGSACIHVPWYMYNYYGDTRLLETYYDKMKLFVASVWNNNEVADKPGIFTDVLADWCSPHGNISDEGAEVYTTMNFYLVLKRMAKIAEIVGKNKDCREFEKQAQIVQDAIYSYCFDEEKMIFRGITPSLYRQGPNAMALNNKIVKPEHKAPVYQTLLNDIEKNRDYHFYGGIFTGYSLWEYLPKNQQGELAYKVAANNAYPGYGFMLKNGATSLWEHWENKSSHIHYFMGFVDNFLIRHVAGIDVNKDVPGFREIIFAPKFISEINHAEASYESIHGLVSIRCERKEQGIIYAELEVPCNCSGKIILPEFEKYTLEVDGKSLNTQSDSEKEFVIIPSGKTHLTINLKQKEQ